jgi:membrane-associated phospholipid phosphatase
MVVAVMLPTLQGKYRQAQHYIVAVTLGAILTAGMFTMWPAVGPWTVYGYRPLPDQAAAQAYLLALKSPGPVTVNIDIAAIVSFPSFHVALASLSAAALWPYRKFRPVLGALCAGICVSTIATGWHYVIDMVGGLTVTVAAQTMANNLLSYVLQTPQGIVEHSSRTPAFTSGRAAPLH